MLQIFIFGDSIAHGLWDRKGGWAARLRASLDERNLNRKISPDLDPQYLIYNLGVPGDTSNEILIRFDFETDQRYWDKRDAIVIFAVGLNDSVWEDGKQWVSKKQLDQNLEQLVTKARKFTEKIIFLGPTPTDNGRVDPMKWHPTQSYKLKSVKDYNEKIKSFCLKNNIGFIDVFSDFIKVDYTKLLEDGAHPNTHGHQRIYNAVKRYLIQEKFI